MSAVVSEIRRTLDVLFAPGQVVELRVFTDRGTLRGYFDDFDVLAREAASVDGRAEGIYVTLNPVRPELLARSVNRMRRAKQGDSTADHDILRRCWFPVDFDPVRPKGISSTDGEHDAALERARECARWLLDLGWPKPLGADSGNGFHALYRVDLPNDDATRGLFQACLEALDLRFGDELVKVDRTTFNAGRIWKLYGTLACKGDATEERPYRRSELRKEPGGPVGPEFLEALAATAPRPGRNRKTPREDATLDDLGTALAAAGLEVARSGSWKDGGWKWVLATCPWNEDHTDLSAYVVRFANGAVAAGCHHDGCAERSWADLKELLGLSSRGESSTNGQGLFRLLRGSDVKIERMRWAWHRRIPLDGVTLVPGREGLGKTAMVYDLAAQLTRGELEGDLFGVPADIIVITTEDAVTTVHAPRLIAAGADMKRVHFLESRDPDCVIPFMVPRDVDALNRLLDEVDNPGMIIVDPLDSHLEVDTHKKAETQRAVGYLANVAKGRHLAVVGIAHHSKAPTTDPLDRVNGSKAFTTSVRSVLTVAMHPDEENVRVVATNKHNHTAPNVPVLKFVVEQRFVTQDDRIVETAAVAWKGVAEGFDPDTVLAPRPSDEEATRLEAAMDWLKKVLTTPTPSADIKKWAKAAEIAERTLQRARELLKVEVVTDVGDKGRRTIWNLPPKPSESDGEDGDEEGRANTSRHDPPGTTPKTGSDQGECTDDEGGSCQQKRWHDPPCSESSDADDDEFVEVEI